MATSTARCFVLGSLGLPVLIFSRLPACVGDHSTAGLTSPNLGGTIISAHNWHIAKVVGVITESHRESAVIRRLIYRIHYVIDCYSACKVPQLRYLPDHGEHWESLKIGFVEL